MYDMARRQKENIKSFKATKWRYSDDWNPLHLQFNDYITWHSRHTRDTEQVISKSSRKYLAISCFFISSWILISLILPSHCSSLNFWLTSCLAHFCRSVSNVTCCSCSWDWSLGVGLFWWEVPAFLQQNQYYLPKILWFNLGEDLISPKYTYNNSNSTREINSL